MDLSGLEKNRCAISKVMAINSILPLFPITNIIVSMGGREVKRGGPWAEMAVNSIMSLTNIIVSRGEGGGGEKRGAPWAVMAINSILSLLPMIL